MANKAEQQIIKLVQKWAARLGITDYEFDFKFVSDREIGGDYARVDTNEDTREVVIELNRTRLRNEPEEVERTIVHELLHTRFNEYADFVIDLIKEHVPSLNTRRFLKARTEKLEHKIVKALTDALAPRKGKN